MLMPVVGWMTYLAEKIFSEKFEKLLLALILISILEMKVSFFERKHF